MLCGLFYRAKQENVSESVCAHKQLNRLAPQKKSNNRRIKGKSVNIKRTTRRNGKRVRKQWETEGLKQELEKAQSTQHSAEPGDVSVTRARTRCHLHQILSNQSTAPPNIKKRKIDSQNGATNKIKNDDLSHLCNGIETEIFTKSNQKINKNYMEQSRNLLFNLRQNKSLRTQLMSKQINPRQFVAMEYTELATESLTKLRTLHQKQRLDEINSITDDSKDWIECTAQCTNCGHAKCKYKMKRISAESTKAAVFGGIPQASTKMSI